MSKSCENCINYGFPCLNCAEYIHKGDLGPGFNNLREREIPLDIESEIRGKMISWSLENKSTYVIKCVNN